MLQPMFDRVLVLEHPPEAVLKSGLHVPDLDPSKRRFGTGDVVSVGCGLIGDGTFVPLSVKSGDVVMFRLPSGSEIEIDGVVHRLLRESDIYGVIER